MLITTLLTAKIAIAAYRGLMNSLVIVIRNSNRQIEILVKVKVAKVCDNQSKVAGCCDKYQPAAIRRRRTS